MSEQKKTIAAMKKDPDGTITLTISLAREDIKKVWEEEVEKAVKTATLPGFREGKAPRKLIEEKIDKEKIREEVLKKLLPKAYMEAVNQFHLKPIINPKIHVEKFEEGKDQPDRPAGGPVGNQDWEFSAITCEAPEVKLNDYKDAVKKITAKSKIIIPGKEQQKPNFDDIVKAVLEKITMAVPKILVEGETERLLAQLLSEIKSLGLSLDQYLASSNKTVETVKKEYQTKAENDIKFEFALQKIADTENIIVEPKEIDEALQKAKDATERKQLETNVYLLASILKQQKTLDFLKNL